MYNLLVSADKNAWRGGNFSIEISRCINKDEYTDEELAKKYGNLNNSDIKELKKFPCIFAYEEKCEKNPKFGYIKQVLKGKGSLTISYEIVKLDRFLTHSDIQKLAFELGIPNWEMSRTHWALKEIELVDLLKAKGIQLSDLSSDRKISNSSGKSKHKNKKKTKARKISTINIKNSQIHLGKGDNVKAKKILNKPKGSKVWYKNFAFWALIVAVISIPWWPNLIRKIRNNKPNLIEEAQQVTITTVSEPLGPVRALEPLETGKKIGELPNGVYFFAFPHSIQSEIGDPDRDYLEASSRDTSYSYEVQKIENRYYLIGFISDEAHSKIGSIAKEPVNTQVFPNSWEGANKVVAIPFDSIDTIKSRTIDLYEAKRVDIFDIVFWKVVENPDLHKIKDL